MVDISKNILQKFRKFHIKILHSNYSWEQDQAVAEWLKHQFKEESSSQLIKDHLKVMKTESMMSQFRYVHIF